MMATWLITARSQAGIHPPGELLFALPEGPLPRGLPGRFHCFLLRDRNPNVYPDGPVAGSKFVSRRLDIKSLSSLIQYCLAAKPFTPVTWSSLKDHIIEDPANTDDPSSGYPLNFEGGYRITPWVDDALRFLIGENIDPLRRLITPSRSPLIFGSRRLSRYLPR